MSDNHHRYRSIRIGLSQMFPKELKGYGAKQLNVLASLISGIVGSKSTNYPKIAGKVPDRAKAESRVKRYSRYINEADPEQEIYLMPFAADLLAKLSAFTLVLIIDGSDVGRNCVTLMLSVRYRGRALPIGWLVISGKKGHFSEERHIQLVTAVQKLVPEGADVVFLGDGEFDGTELQAKLEEFGWEFVCRTAKNAILFAGHEFSFQELLVQPGDCLSIEEVLFTRQRYGPLLAVIWWRKGYKEPLYLISNLGLKEEACLMIAACLAYLWIVGLGLWSMRNELHKVVHRTERCDLSLFQLGLRVLDYLIDSDLAIPVSFTDFSHAYPNFVR